MHCLRFILYLYAELVQLIKDKLSFVNILEEKPNLVVNKKVNANGIHWEKKHSLQNKFKQIHCGGTKIIQRQKEAWKSNITMQSKAQILEVCRRFFGKCCVNIMQIFWKYCGNIVVQGKAAKILEVCRSFLELGIRSGAGFPGTGEEANYCALVPL